MAKSAITAYLLDESFQREFYMTSIGVRADFAKTKWRELFEGKKTYNLAAGWVVEATGENAAEEAFDLSNNPCRQDERNLFWGDIRSLSVGDIVEVNNHEDGRQFFLCDSVGWVKLEN